MATTKLKSSQISARDIKEKLNEVIDGGATANKPAIQALVSPVADYANLAAATAAIKSIIDALKA